MPHHKSNLSIVGLPVKIDGNRLRNLVFYTLRPVIPRSVQIFLRRQIARYKRRKYTSTWPIDPSAGKKPKGWKGWPGGKKFAVVLTHDVDTHRGYQNCLKLAEIEEDLGFRSCFNFVPERYGQISIDLISELKRRGFAVGVHGLKHDGKLFLTKKTFERRASRINNYLKKWGTRGFTAPSMIHNFQWMHILDIDYSISTFDTDPFEPYPNGVATIFPFLVDSVNQLQAFVEIPYTLPQDFTLFIILQENGNKIWKQKIRWIARHGGLALLNTHPDYMCFDRRNPGKFTYDVKYYAKFLRFIRSEFKDEFYHSLPSGIFDFMWATYDSFNGLETVDDHKFVAPIR